MRTRSPNSRESCFQKLTFSATVRLQELVKVKHYCRYNSRHVVLLETDSEDEMIAVFPCQVGEVLVCPFLHGKESSVEFKRLLPTHEILNCRIEDAVEFNGMTFKIRNGWDDVKIGHESLQEHPEAINGRILSL